MCFIICVFFYKQTHDSLQILQIEDSQIHTLPELVEERSPIVLRHTRTPANFTREAMRKIPRLGATTVAATPLENLLDGSVRMKSDGPPALGRRAAEELAAELGIPLWVERQWSEYLRATSYFGWLGTVRARVGFGGVGLFKTTAQITVLLPTEGAYIASILPPNKQALLPKQWQYRYPDVFTPNDTPFVNELEYVDMKLRAGTALLLPPHWFVSLRPEDWALFLVIEYHEPISLLATTLENA